MADLSGVWQYDTSQVLAAPAAGYLRSGPAPVSWLAFSTHTKGGADMAANLLALTSGAQIALQEVNDATLASRFELTGDPVDHISWVEYPVVAVATTATGPPRPNQDLLVVAYAAAAATHTPYVDVSELQRVLGITSPTAAELDAMNRNLEDAAAQIDWDLGYSADNPAPTPISPILADVNLDRAAELWAFQTRATAGIIVLPGVDAVPLFPPKDTWYRHHLRLTPLRTEFAIG